MNSRATDIYFHLTFHKIELLTNQLPLEKINSICAFKNETKRLNLKRIFKIFGF
jgi:hypothetical protein